LFDGVFVGHQAGEAACEPFTMTAPACNTRGWSTPPVLPTAGIVGGRLHQSGFGVVPIGTVESPLVDVASAPKQGHEGAPDAWLVFEADVFEGLQDLRPGDHVIVLTWLDRARRDVLRVHPRDDLTKPELGVFSTRSADRPNPIGLHPVEIVSVDGLRVRVRGIEAVDGTPIIDVKPVPQGAGPFDAGPEGPS